MVGLLRGLVLALGILADTAANGAGSDECWQSARAMREPAKLASVAAACSGDDGFHSCLHIGCSAEGRFEFLPMILGDWITGRAHLQVGSIATETILEKDQALSRWANSSVSRGVFDRTFLERIQSERKLSFSSVDGDYQATWELTGYQGQFAATRSICRAP